jgi:ElaB/YqjD/DUF883 family membrane-anchored ribosome-binding protein
MAMGEGQPSRAELESEAVAHRRRLADNMGELGARVTPENLWNEGVSRAKTVASREVRQARDALTDLADDLVIDTLSWMRANQTLLLSGAGIAAAGALGTGLVKRRRRAQRTVPIYAAYEMEDPAMMDDSDNAGRWDRVKDGAGDVQDRASEAYYSARARATQLADEARHRAAEAADLARARAHEAAEAAREAAHRAREAAADAGRWAQRQPDERPVSIVAVGLVVGLALGLLLPRTRQEDEWLGDTRDNLAEDAKTRIRQAYDAAGARLKEAGVTGDNARTKIAEFAETAKSVLSEAGAAAVERIGKREGSVAAPPVAPVA